MNDKRILVYFRTSRNAHSHINLGLYRDRLNKLCKLAKKELIHNMRKIADILEKDEPESEDE